MAPNSASPRRVADALECSSECPGFGEDEGGGVSPGNYCSRRSCGYVGLLMSNSEMYRVWLKYS